MAANERIVQNWRLGKTLGKGAYGLVKEGIHITNGKKYAMKFMTKDAMWEEREKKKVAIEIESLRTVRHSNVMKLFAYDLSCQYPKEDGSGSIETVLLVLELCPGGELFDILYYTQSLPEILARTYFTQLIIGLEAIHAEGITHRDLKPQNLLLDGRYNLKIIDFGLANIFEGDASQELNLLKTTAVGTKGYQSPEIVLGREYTNLCDIFACGVILFVMLTGYPPFETANAKTDKWYKKIAAKKYPKFWSRHSGCGISDQDVMDLICGMLTYQPNERWTLEQVKECAWFNGPTLEGDALVNAMKQRHYDAVHAKKNDVRSTELENASIVRDLEWDDTLEVPVIDSGDVSRFFTFEFDTDNYEVKEVFQMIAGRIEETGVCDFNNETWTLKGTIEFQHGDSIDVCLRALKRSAGGPTLISLDIESSGNHMANTQFFDQMFKDVGHMLGNPFVEDFEVVEYGDEDYNLM